MREDMLRKYAELIVKVGAGLQPGQTAMIHIEAQHYCFARILAEACYKAGAKQVMMEWSDQQLTKLAYQHETAETLSEVHSFAEEKQRWMVEKLPAHIYIMGDDPDGLAGLDPEKMQRIQIARSKIIKPYRDARECKEQWVIAAIPSTEWALKVFPELPAEEAVDRLWETILSCCRVTEDGDALEAWEQHNRNFLSRCEKLNQYGFDHLRYKNSIGTDFTVGLIPGARWAGGGDYTLGGIYFNPNLPTEEIFNSPMAGKCEGTLVASKPLSYNGMLIENFSITFKNGEAVEWHAEKGEEVLTQIITMDEGSKKLGEVALVPYTSPISKSGIMFYETLFDENASCHVALGFGFNNVLPGFDKMTLSEIHKAGVNDSVTHVDFMIGTRDLSIIGVTPEGEEVDVFKDGEWAQAFC